MMMMMMMKILVLTVNALQKVHILGQLINQFQEFLYISVSGMSISFSLSLILQSLWKTSCTHLLGNWIEFR